MSSEDMDGVPSAKQPTVVSSTEASPAGLTRYTLEGCGLSIVLPAAPVDSEVELAGVDRHRLGPVKCHTSVGNGYVVIVCHIQASGQATFEGQLDEFVEGFFRGISSSPGHSNARYTIGDKSSNRESFRASFEMKGVPVEIEGFAQLQGRHGWIVTALYPFANSAAVESARKVLASPRFDGPPCPE
jgi:hypothetical protein